MTRFSVFFILLYFSLFSLTIKAKTNTPSGESALNIPGIHLITNSKIYVTGFITDGDLFYMSFNSLLRMLKTHSIKELVLTSQEQTSFLHIEDLHSVDAVQDIAILKIKTNLNPSLKISDQSPVSKEALFTPLYIPNRGFQKIKKLGATSHEDKWLYSFYANRFPLNSFIHGAPILLNDQGKVKVVGMVHSYSFNKLTIVKSEHLIRLLENEAGSFCSDFHNAQACMKNELDNLKYKAETEGDPKAQFEWGAIVYTGTKIGVVKNEEQGLSLINQSAEQGFIPAQLYRYWSSKVPEEVILSSLESMINQGVVEAKFYLALKLYKNRKLEEAFSLFKELAEQDHLLSQFNLSAMYNKGEGTKQDDQQVLYWLRRAVKNGHIPAIKELKIKEKSLKK